MLRVALVSALLLWLQGCSHNSVNKASNKNGSGADGEDGNEQQFQDSGEVTEKGHGQPPGGKKSPNGKQNRADAPKPSVESVHGVPGQPGPGESPKRNTAPKNIIPDPNPAPPAGRGISSSGKSASTPPKPYVAPSVPHVFPPPHPSKPKQKGNPPPPPPAATGPKPAPKPAPKPHSVLVFTETTLRLSADGHSMVNPPVFDRSMYARLGQRGISQTSEGNSCYLAVSLQLLLHAKPFRDAVVASVGSRKAPGEISALELDIIHIFNQQWGRESLPSDAIRMDGNVYPSFLWVEAQRYLANPERARFKPGGQSDATEAIEVLVQLMAQYLAQSAPHNNVFELRKGANTVNVIQVSMQPPTTNPTVDLHALIQYFFAEVIPIRGGLITVFPPVLVVLVPTQYGAARIIPTPQICVQASGVVRGEVAGCTGRAYELVGIDVFTGVHYMSYFQHPDTRQWYFADDASVVPVPSMRESRDRFNFNEPLERIGRFEDGKWSVMSTVFVYQEIILS